ncbi:hypothetical protein Pfo_009514 [Paulownia fortunei]|nr:hypothetical protein Pfo_009514 [Paulownia fortunei]
MESTLANIISNLLVLRLKSLNWDSENFFSSAHFLPQTFLIFFSTKWNSLCSKLQISNTSDEPLHQVSCNKETFGDEKRIHIAEINLMMNRLGIVGGLEDNGDNSLGAEDFLALFDEEEPSLEEIKETFGVFDLNKDGFIDASELQRVLCNLGLKERCKLEECTRMIKPFDGNGDGLIDFQEFVKFIEKCLC